MSRDNITPKDKGVANDEMYVKKFKKSLTSDQLGAISQLMSNKNEEVKSPSYDRKPSLFKKRNKEDEV